MEYLNISGVLSLPQEIILQRLAHLIVDDKRQIISMLMDAFCRKNNFYPEFFEVIRIFQMPVKGERSLFEIKPHPPLVGEQKTLNMGICRI